MAGRFVWSSTSDVIGRKPIYMGYLGVGMALYALLALAGHNSTALFVLFAGIIISFYGGGFATVPAYLRDLFGTFQVGAIHGRLLTAWSAAGVAGPLIVNGFLDAEGTPGKLTYEAYKPALLTMVGVLAVGLRGQPADPPGRRPLPREGPPGDPAAGARRAPERRRHRHEDPHRHADPEPRGAAGDRLGGRRPAAGLRRLPDTREDREPVRLSRTVSARVPKTACTSRDCSSVEAFVAPGSRRRDSAIGARQTSPAQSL